jgi:hypothetical protein
MFTFWPNRRNGNILGGNHKVLSTNHWKLGKKHNYFIVISILNPEISSYDEYYSLSFLMVCVFHWSFWGKKKNNNKIWKWKQVNLIPPHRRKPRVIVCSNNPWPATMLLPMNISLWITNKPCSPKRIVLRVWYFKNFKNILQNEPCLHSCPQGVTEIFWDKITRFCWKISEN